MRVTVHILCYGYTLCRQIHGLPKDWGPKHKWVGFSDMRWPAVATCPTCKEQASRMAEALDPRDVEARVW